MSQCVRKPDRPDKYKSFELSKKKAEIVKRLADGTMKVAEVARVWSSSYNSQYLEETSW